MNEQHSYHCPACKASVPHEVIGDWECDSCGFHDNGNNRMLLEYIAELQELNQDLSCQLAKERDDWNNWANNTLAQLRHAREKNEQWFYIYNNLTYQLENKEKWARTWKAAARHYREEACQWMAVSIHELGKRIRLEIENATDYEWRDGDCGIWKIGEVPKDESQT